VNSDVGVKLASAAPRAGCQMGARREAPDTWQARWETAVRCSMAGGAYGVLRFVAEASQGEPRDTRKWLPQITQLCSQHAVFNLVM
jgi:hypothetical protein